MAGVHLVDIAQQEGKGAADPAFNASGLRATEYGPTTGDLWYDWDRHGVGPESVAELAVTASNPNVWTGYVSQVRGAGGSRWYVSGLLIGSRAVALWKYARTFDLISGQAAYAAIGVTRFRVRPSIRSKQNLIDISGKYPNQEFSAVIFKNREGVFGDVTRYDGKILDVDGTVRMYGGKPKIILIGRASFGPNKISRASIMVEKIDNIAGQIRWAG